VVEERNVSAEGAFLFAAILFFFRTVGFCVTDTIGGAGTGAGLVAAIANGTIVGTGSGMLGGSA
jgi:hypothetical protein